MTEAKKLIPKRRFREFQDFEAWEQYRLGDKLEFFKGKGLPLDSFRESSEEPAIAYGHLYTKYSEVINEVKLSSFDEGVLSISGDLLFPGSSTVPNGTAQSNAIMLDGVKLGGDVIIGRQKNEDIFAPFLSYQINSQKEKLYPITVGTTITHMYGKDLSKVSYSFPCYKEQKTIGSFFNDLDNLITIHQRKLEKIKSLKKAYLFEMFPTEGESRPKRRFKGFTDDWEQCKLGQVVQIKDSARIPNALWRRDGVPYLRSSNLDNATDEMLYIEQEDYEMYKSKTGAPELGDVLFNSGGNIGTAILKNDTNPVYVQGGAVLYIKTSTSEKLEGMFLKFYFETPTQKKYILHASVGGTIKHFTLVPANAMPITYPQKDEQKQIGFFFYKLDNLITLHQSKIDKLQNLKKAYLNEMFI